MTSQVKVGVHDNVFRLYQINYTDCQGKVQR